MKPKLLIKRVSGREYLQLKTRYEEIIHIGPADDVENWVVGYCGLDQEYESLALHDAMQLNEEMVKEAYREYQLDYRNVTMKWDKFCEKRIRAMCNKNFYDRLREYLQENPGFDIDGFVEDKYGDLVDFHTRIQSITKICNQTILSPELYLLFSDSIIGDSP